MFALETYMYMYQCNLKKQQYANSVEKVVGSKATEKSAVGVRKLAEQFISWYTMELWQYSVFLLQQ